MTWQETRPSGELELRGRRFREFRLCTSRKQNIVTGFSPFFCFPFSQGFERHFLHRLNRSK